jgi:hypothetical protein
LHSTFDEQAHQNHHHSAVFVRIRTSVNQQPLILARKTDGRATAALDRSAPLG